MYDLYISLQFCAKSRLTNSRKIYVKKEEYLRKSFVKDSEITGNIFRKFYVNLRKLVVKPFYVYKLRMFT